VWYIKIDTVEDTAFLDSSFYAFAVTIAEPLAWQFYGANLGPIRIPQLSKCSETARKFYVSR
jgi:hypothetical protein